MSNPVRKSEPGTSVTRSTSNEDPYDVRPVPASTGQPYALKSPIAKILTDPAALALIRPIMPAGASMDQFIFEAYHAVTQNPEILECTPQSIVLAVGRAIESGLQIGKTIHLVPVNTKISKRGDPDQYEKRLQAWFDYRGEIELVMRAGVARFVDAHAVYSEEEFKVEQGTNPNIYHVPILDSKKRGRLIGGYAYAILPGRLVKIFTMTLDEVEAVRKNSRQWKHLAECPPWYVEKTCIHRVTKTLPKNDKLLKVLALFDKEERDDREDPDLDPSNQIAALQSDLSSPSSEARSQIQPGTESATHGEGATSADGEEWTPPSEQADEPAQPRKRFAVEEARLPFGANVVGRPIWMVSTVDLESAYDFAKKTKRFKEFADAAESVLELRRVGDLPEPTAEELALPTPPITNQQEARHAGQ